MKKNTISPITEERHIKSKLVSKAARIGNFKKLTVSWNFWKTHKTGSNFKNPFKNCAHPLIQQSYFKNICLKEKRLFKKFWEYIFAKYENWRRA